MCFVSLPKVYFATYEALQKVFFWIVTYIGTSVENCIAICLQLSSKKSCFFRITLYIKKEFSFLQLLLFFFVTIHIRESIKTDSEHLELYENKLKKN